MKLYDAVVIGEGPAGITAALYLARSGCSVLLFEQLTAGGQILQTEGLENYPGFPKGIKGYELADLFAAHIAGYELIEHSPGGVTSVSGSAGDFLVKAEANEEAYHAKTVVVCTGARHRQLGVENENRYIGRGVSYCALCDGNFYRDQTVAVVGGGNAALEESLYLAKIASKVILIHRRDEFRGAMVYQKKLEALTDKVQIMRDTIVVSLIGEPYLDAVNIRNLKTNIETRLPVNGLFIYVGFEPVTAFLPTEIEKDGQGFLVTDTEMRTSIPGIFAAGDIRSKLCRQVITAAGDGATAAQSAFIFVESLHA